MKSRYPERPIAVRDWRRRLLNDRQLVAWAKRVARGAPTKPQNLDEGQLVMLGTEILRQRHQQFNADHFIKAVERRAV